MTDRYDRQSTIVPRDRLTALDIQVVGVGAVGRQAAIQLASIGAHNLTLTDFDLVEPTNLVTQAYYEEDIGLLKTEATRNVLRQINSNAAFHVVNDRWRPRNARGNVIFSCVDSISVRERIFQWALDNQDTSLFLDARILGETIRVLACDLSIPEQVAIYTGSLFPEEETIQGRCTAQSTIFTAMLAASHMMHQFTRWLRDGELTPDLTINLPADMLTANLAPVA